MDSITNKIGILITQTRTQTIQQINTIMVQTYWEIGRTIVEEQQQGKEKAEYGKYLLENLSKELTNKFGKGFSKRNLEQFRKFHLTFPIAQTVSTQLGWSHYTELLRISNSSKRDFYIKELESQRWSVRELKRQMNSSLYERLALSRDKTNILKLSKEGHIIETPSDLIKDPYVLEFLNLEEKPEYTEKEFEQGLFDNMEKFILELGKGFSFVSRQQRITLDNTHFYSKYGS